MVEKNTLKKGDYLHAACLIQSKANKRDKRSRTCGTKAVTLNFSFTLTSKIKLQNWFRS